MSTLIWALHGGIPEHMFVCCFFLLFFVGLVVFEKNMVLKIDDTSKCAGTKSII